MTNCFVIGRQAHTEIMAHLLKNRLEQVAFVFAKTTPCGEGVQFTCMGHHLVQPEELAFHSPYHVELSEQTQANLIKGAWDRGASLVEIHSHPNTKSIAEFSSSDLLGFQEFIPHVWWRLKGKPYAALVVGPNGFDALVWRVSPDSPEQLAYLQYGDIQWRPSSMTLRKIRR